MPYDRAVVNNIRALIDSDIHRITVMDKERCTLRNVCIYAQRRERGDRNNWRRGRDGSGGLRNQGARIDVARSDYSINRRADDLI